MTEFSGLPLAIKPNPRAKRVLVKLIPNKGIEVVVPKRFDTRQVPDILEDKRGWIERTRSRLEAQGVDFSGRDPELPEIIDLPTAERAYDVSYIDGPLPVRVTENATRLLVRGPSSDEPALLEGLRKFVAKKAREILLPRLDEISRATGLHYSAMRVRRQKTRWGSCSARGTISVNAKLLFLPRHLSDHLLLHELCHTRQLNHSPKYWALVESLQPDYRRLEEDLKHGNRYVPDWF